jgi:catechol 2,3-dioxygenase-like lactoylglutathione lyase family enzyme
MSDSTAGPPSLVFHHAGLTVSDLERSLNFWRDGLGLEVLLMQEKRGGYIEAITGEPGASVRQAHLQDPGSRVRVELLQYLAPPGRPHEPRPRDPGTGHVGFVCSDLAGLLDRLIAHGGKPVSAPVLVDTGANAGLLAVYVRDPDGHIVELDQPPDAD